MAPRNFEVPDHLEPKPRRQQCTDCRGRCNMQGLAGRNAGGADCRRDPDRGAVHSRSAAYLAALNDRLCRRGHAQET